MSAAERPWWASDGDALGDDDPVAAHRRARRPSGDPPPAEEQREDDGSWWVPATEAVTRLVRDLTASPPRGLGDDPPAEDGGGDGSDGHTVDACGICPVCVGLRALGEARPELVGHLAEAARQLSLAVRSVIEASTEAAPDRSPDAARRRPHEDRLQHIDLDDA